MAICFEGQPVAEINKSFQVTGVVVRDNGDRIVGPEDEFVMQGPGTAEIVTGPDGMDRAARKYDVAMNGRTVELRLTIDKMKLEFAPELYRLVKSFPYARLERRSATLGEWFRAGITGAGTPVSYLVRNAPPELRTKLLELKDRCNTSRK